MANPVATRGRKRRCAGRSSRPQVIGLANPLLYTCKIRRRSLNGRAAAGLPGHGRELTAIAWIPVGQHHFRYSAASFGLVAGRRAVTLPTLGGDLVPTPPGSRRQDVCRHVLDDDGSIGFRVQTVPTVVSTANPVH